MNLSSTTSCGSVLVKRTLTDHKPAVFYSDLKCFESWVFFHVDSHDWSTHRPGLIDDLIEAWTLISCWYQIYARQKQLSIFPVRTDP